MDSNEKKEVMAEAVKPILSILSKRIKNKMEALKAYEYGPMDIVDSEIKKMREIEAIKLRHEVDVLIDLIDIIQAMYPSA